MAQRKKTKQHTENRKHRMALRKQKASFSSALVAWRRRRARKHEGRASCAAVAHTLSVCCIFNARNLAFLKARVTLAQQHISKK